MGSRFLPTRASGLERLAAFLPHAGKDYAARRNSDVKNGATVSRLSPWLRHRIVTETEVIAAVRAQHDNRDCMKFVQEVLWRGYWKGWLEQRPSVWSAYRQGLHAALDRVQTEAGLRAAWESACLGQTGIDGFDHWARELAATGYLHNHARMWFASIWIFTLRLPWELGADFFLRHLLDGDPASNTLSWRWVGGMQTVGKTYLARADNIDTYTGGRFRPEGLATRAEALPAQPAPKPLPLPLSDKLDPGLRSVLLLHEDDLSPGFLFDRGLRPVATALLADPEGRSPLAVSASVASFVREGVTRAAEDHADQLGPVRPLSDPDPAALLDWVEAQDARQIVTAYAPVGPMARRLREIGDEAARRGLDFVRILREEDAAHWPHATHGFFRFWETVGFR